MSSGLEYKQLVLQTLFAVANTGSSFTPSDWSKEQKKLDDAAMRSRRNFELFSNNKHKVKVTPTPVHQPRSRGRR